MRERRRFPRSCRLVRRAEFEAVYRGGQRRSSASFVVFFLPNGRAESRFGISVKRALGKATVRSRIRRRVREIFRLHRRELPAGWDIVVHPRGPVARLRFALLAEELIGVLRKALART